MKLLLILLAGLMIEANQQYADGNYAEAAMQYEQILTEQKDAEVYYNLGNAYFKQGELAQAILSYERCLRLNPRHSDARHNLLFAENRVTDRIEDTQTFFVATLMTRLRNQLSEPTWVLLGIVLFFVVIAGVFGFLLGKNSGIRRVSFFVGLAALVLSISALCNGASLHHRDTAREEAIITQGIVNAKSSPDRSGTDLFTLHEGTKVTIHEVIGDWANVHVGNYVGWIKLSNLERI